MVPYHPSLVLVQTLLSDLGASQSPFCAHRFENGHIPSSTPFVEDFYSLHSVFTPVVTLTGVVVDTWTLDLYLTFLFMSHHSPHCFLWEQLSWYFLPISYSLDSLLTILDFFGLIWLSCRVHFVHSLRGFNPFVPIIGIMSKLAYRLGFHIHFHFAWPYDCFILTLGTNPFHGIMEPSCCC